MNIVLKSVNLSKSTFYYKAKDGKQGRKASMYTHDINGNIINNDVVLEKIESLLVTRFVDYGYIKTTKYLNMQENLLLNKKKVYRLMNENNLLKNKKIKSKLKRTFVKFRKVKAQKPFEILEIDIKYVYIAGEKRNVYLLTLLDVFSRKAIEFIVQPSIRKADVIKLFEKALDKIPSILEITVRCDNGSQFVAHDVQNYLLDVGIKQEFTHVSTPQENAHIESFHSILERELFQKMEFDCFNELATLLDDFYKFYNQNRIHSSINYMSPDNFLQLYYLQQNDKNIINNN